MGTWIGLCVCLWVGIQITPAVMPNQLVPQPLLKSFLQHGFWTSDAIAASAPEARLGSASATRPIRAMWLGIAGLLITDGETTLLFDPVMSRPQLRHWLFNQRFQADESKVVDGLNRAGVQKADAIFVSHEHFDHSVDAALVSRLTRATVYGGDSLSVVAQKNEFPVQFQKISDHESIQLGQFTVTPYSRHHPAIFYALDWRFLPGPVPADFDFKFYQYREGEVWGYRVEHPAGHILIDQGSHFFEGNAKRGRPVDVYFVGVANKKSIEDLIQNNIERVAPQLVVPLHYDAFFLDWSWLEGKEMPGVNLEGIRQAFESRFQGRCQWMQPKKYELMRL
jgi:L-ascorbate metabolism protein UlaG (beta-lactamase superfamily)